MLYRVFVAVVRAVPERPTVATGEDPWDETVSYSFCINATDPSRAASVAAHAAEHAVDRGGDFIGGVVVELQVRCIGVEEVANLGDYLMQPIDHPGIFYVTGVTFSGAWLTTTTGTAEQLHVMRQRIRQDGIPAPSFVHPPLKAPEPTFVRILCPVCGHWVEVDNAGLLYSFWTGGDLPPEESEAAQGAVQIAKPFVERHFKCLEAVPDRKSLSFLYSGDERYSALDAAMRE